MKILLIKRAARFSPNMQDKDAAILFAVAQQLEKTGCGTEVCSEDELPNDLEGWSAIAHMARSEKTLHSLCRVEEMGIPIVNSARCLMQMNRRVLLATCQENGICVPPFAINGKESLTFPLWWKRDDRVSQEVGDVRLIHNEEEWEEVISSSVKEYVAEQHMEGDLIKFYSVRNTDFFHWLYPTFSKFGKECANGKAYGLDFDEKELKTQADKLANAMGIDVFGGDAVIGKDGKAYIIDFNDWPSFSSCREDAAEAIAQTILHKTNGQG